MVAILCREIFNMGNINIIIIGAMMPILPGLAFTNAIRDTMNGDLVSGVAKTGEVFQISVSIAFGVGTVLSVYSMLGGII